MNNSSDKQSVLYEKHGALKDAEPLFTPDARGLFMVVKATEEPDEDTLLKIHMHAQSVLKEESEEYAKAQEWWSNLPKTPTRQMENLFVCTPALDAVDAEVQAWVDRCDEFEGLVYIFVVERKLNLVRNKTQEHIPVVAFSMQDGFRSLDDIEEEDCVTYRMYFAYYEKPETLSNKKSGA